MNSIKTKSRNKLITSTLNGILLADQTVKKSGCCLKFAPIVEMQNYMTAANIYDTKEENKICDNIDDEITFG